MRLGRKNRKANYYLNGKQIQNASGQRDLCVYVHESQKVGMQVQHVIKKANGMLAFIAKGLEYESRECCCNCTGCW